MPLMPLQAALLGGAPIWVPNNATEYMNMLTGQYYVNGNVVGTLPLALSTAGYTFARASEASYIDSTGTIQFATANTVRLDWDPTTLAQLGMFIEGERTNISSWTEDFTQSYWNKTTQGTTISADATTAPDGQNTADKILETTGNLWHAVFHSQTLTSSVPYAISSYLKQAERIWGGDYTYYSSTDRGSWFNLSTGAISTSGIGTKSNQQFPNNWWRCILRFTPSAAPARFGIKISNAQDATGYVGVATSGIYGWGIQVEQAAFESSYIRELSGATATRSADSLTRPITQPVTLARVFRVLTPPGTGGNQTIWSEGDTTNGFVVQRNSSGHVALIVYAGGVAVASLDAGGVGTNAVHRVAVCLDGTSAKICMNGGAVYSATVPIPTMTTLVERIGSSSVSGEEWFGHIQSYASYRILADGQMQALTSPGAYINALVGIDSLSDPPSTGVGRYLRDVMQTRIGVASAGWVPLIFESNTRVSGLNYTGGVQITRTTGYSGDDRTLDWQGRRWVTSDGSSISFFTPIQPYDQLDTIWISQPGDGSVRFQSTGNGGAILDASTALATHIQRIECFTAPNATVRWDQFTGSVSIVGVNFSRAGAAGFTYNPFGNAGYQVHQLAGIDDTSMRQIIAAINPTHFVFNGGMNDRLYYDSTTFNTDCRKVLDNVKAGAPACKIIVIQALDPSDAASSYWLSYVPVKQQLAIDYNGQYLDLRTINANTATYALANAAGYMQDGVHPTIAFNRDINAPWQADNIAW
jgi:hypothetical protein